MLSYELEVENGNGNIYAVDKWNKIRELIAVTFDERIARIIVRLLNDYANDK